MPKLSLATFKRAPQVRDPVQAFAADAATRDALMRVFLERRLPGTLVVDGGIGAALHQVGPENAPPLLIVDVTDAAEPVADIAALAAATGADTRIIAIGAANDIRLYRDLIAAGAIDYLTKPLDAAALNQAIEQAGKAAEAPAGERRADRLIAVIGTRGGVGATTIAVNTAWLLAETHRQRVALVDFDLNFGTVALSLDLEPSRGLREALERPNRIDSLFLDRSLVRAGERLMVLGGEEPLQDGFVVDPSAPGILLDELRQKFDCIVADLPRGNGVLQNEVLTAASHVVVVCQLSLAGMRDAIRVQSLVAERAPQASVLHIGAGAGGTGLAVDEFERGFGHKLKLIVPSDLKAVSAAINAGKTLAETAAGSKPAKSLHQLADELAGPKPEAAPVPFWRRWKK